MEGTSARKDTVLERLTLPDSFVPQLIALL